MADGRWQMADGNVAGDSNQIGGDVANPDAVNTIAFNGGAGIRVTGSGNVSIGRNSIHSNTGLGIDLGSLGVTPNDVGPPHDTDVGPNGLQNFPDIGTVANLEPDSTYLGFELFSTPSTNFEFHLFYSPEADGMLHDERCTLHNFAERSL